MRLPEHLKSWAKETFIWKVGLLISLTIFLLASGPSSGQAIGTSSEFVMVFDKTCFEVSKTERAYLSVGLQANGDLDLNDKFLHHMSVTFKPSCGHYAKKGDLK